MNLKTFRPILQFVVAMGLCYFAHKVYLVTFQENLEPFKSLFSIEVLYVLFSTYSILFYIVLLIIKNKSFDNVGMVFLILTTLKIGCSLLFIKLLDSPTANLPSSAKKNFFMIFFLYLAIDTAFGVRILRNK